MRSRGSTALFFGICLGNLFEHYDTALYALLSPFLAPLFFPTYDPITALLLTYAIIPIGMVARPIGTLVFGYIGDRYGRKRAIVSSLVGMSLATVLMAGMPIYSQIGVLAPILLSLLRISQNFFASGEMIGGAIYLLENSKPEDKGLMSGLYGASTVGGIVLASGAVSLLSMLDLIDSYWRLLYLFGCSTLCCSWFLRLLNYEEEQQLHQEHPLSWPTIFRGFWQLRSTAVAIAVASGFSYASYMIALVMLNGFVPLVSELTKEQMVHLNTCLLILDFLTLPLFGLLGDRISRDNLMLAAAVSAALFGVPLFMLLENGSFWTVVWVRTCFVCIGVGFSATFHSWAQDLVPRSIRYSLIGFSYACGTQLLGGPTAVISLWIYQQTHLVASACLYWILLAALSIVVIVKCSQKSAARGSLEAFETSL